MGFITLFQAMKCKDMILYTSSKPLLKIFLKFVSKGAAWPWLSFFEPSNSLAVEFDELIPFLFLKFNIKKPGYPDSKSENHLYLHFGIVLLF